VAAKSHRRQWYLFVLLFGLGALPGVLPADAGIAGTSGRTVAVLPPQFEDRLVTAVPLPTGMAFTPDGRLLVATQPGRLRVVQGGTLRVTPALDLSSAICSDSERGLLGVAVDPNFDANGYVYLYYTFKKFGSCPRNSSMSPVNRVSRFALSDSNVIDPVSESILVDNIPSPNGNHNAGDLAFGKDGNLYVTTGDGGCHYSGDVTKCNGDNTASRDKHVLVGKVLRITASGGIPPDNPFQGPDTDRCNIDGRTLAGRQCQETFAWGLRNPFRISFDPAAVGTRFFINDVGQSTWEEIDESSPGADYGWNVREGFCRTGSTTECDPPPSGMMNPVYAYGHAEGCASITGGAFIPKGIWPSTYDGGFLYSDYVCGAIFRLESGIGGSYSSSVFASAGSPITLIFGPYGGSKALYYASYVNGGEIRRIAYSGTVNRVPTASLTASPTSGPTPLTVNFDGTASSDPDPGDTLTYIWDFGDGATVETIGATTSHPYATPGTYMASLRVRDNFGAMSDPDTERIDPGNTPPDPTITVPRLTQRFAVGDVVTLQGSALDAQDGVLADSRLSWRVLRHHGDHTHPWLADTIGNNLTMPAAPGPEDIFTTNTSYLEIRLTATDSKGLAGTTTRDFHPRIVDLTFRTAPSGLRLHMFGSDVTGPHTLPAWEAWQFGVNAPRQTVSGRTWVFDAWSDGGGSSHTITTGSTPAAYTATFHENRVPVASPGTVKVVEDIAQTVTLPAMDLDNDVLTYDIARSPVNGTTGSPSGSKVVYTPSAEYYGSDSFGFTATDGDANSAEANVAVTVSEVNDPPVPAPDIATSAEGTPIVVDVLGNDSPGPANEVGQTLNVAAVDTPAHGSATLITIGPNAGKIRYTPSPHYNGPDGFIYQVCDNGTTGGAPDPKCTGSAVAFSFSAFASPLNTALPQIEGSTRAGGIVRADPGEWSRGTIATDFQWLRCTRHGRRCARIAGAAGVSYALRVADILHRVRVRVRVRNRFGSSWALSAPTPLIQSPIVITRIVFDMPGPREDEWITLSNYGARDAQLRGWTITDGDRNVFRFGRFVLRRGRFVTVRTGAGVGNPRRRFWVRGKRVWDDGGDHATLKTPNGTRADSCRYRASLSGSARC
jgi:glucose/arabinose dehydrogenase